MLRALIEDYGFDDETSDRGSPKSASAKFAFPKLGSPKFGLPAAVTTDRCAASSAKS
jgi:hypothetical protein